MIGMLCRRYSLPNSNIYDLGCSLGASTLALRRNAAENCRITGIDNSAAMLSRCEQNISYDNSALPVNLVQADICAAALSDASVIVSNYTVQFIDKSKRDSLYKKIYNALLPGGIFILSEKLRFADENEQSLMAELHHDFKRLRGYSDLEIAAKRQALENVLVPDMADEILTGLKKAGFRTAYQWFRWFNFGSFIAFKN
jgi:tRNA (cmo5U34)-methyltransferase